MEAVLGHVRIEVRNVCDVWLLSDDASCHQNNLVQLIVRLLARGLGLILKGVVHSETRRDKRLVDADFAVTMRQVNRVMNDTAFNMSTSGDLVAALQHRGGICNSTAELVDTNRGYVSMVQWTDVIKSGNFASLGRVKEISYTYYRYCHYHDVLFAYSRGNRTAGSITRLSSKQVIASATAGYVDPRSDDNTDATGYTASCLPALLQSICIT